MLFIFNQEYIHIQFCIGFHVLPLILLIIAPNLIYRNMNASCTTQKMTAVSEHDTQQHFWLQWLFITKYSIHKYPHILPCLLTSIYLSRSIFFAIILNETSSLGKKWKRDNYILLSARVWMNIVFDYFLCFTQNVERIFLVVHA